MCEKSEPLKTAKAPLSRRAEVLVVPFPDDLKVHRGSANLF
jgi:hypothetical protein